MSTITRKIGVEIECILPNGMSSEIADTIRRAGGEIGSDGSIDGDGEGMEIRTKPKVGEAAEDMLKTISKALNESDAKVNTSCGLHVHADASPIALRKLVRYFESGSRGVIGEGEMLLYVHQNTFAMASSMSDTEVALTVVDIIEEGGDLIEASGQHGDGMLVELAGIRSRLRSSPATGRYIIPSSEHGRYYSFVINRNAVRAARVTMFGAMRFFGAVDSTMRAFVSASRRHNSYCQPFEKITRSGGRQPRNLRTVYEGVSDRYCGINMQSLEKHGTIENRYHSGSINGEKIIHWARMWARCVDVALSEDAVREADALVEMVNSKSRMDMFLALLALPEDTEAYLRERATAFGASDGKHAATYIANKKKSTPSEPVVIRTRRRSVIEAVLPADAAELVSVSESDLSAAIDALEA